LSLPGEAERAAPAVKTESSVISLDTLFQTGRW
jgi:hypothetical protein